MRPMADLELTRSRDDRRTYVVDGVGALRLEGWLSRRASAETGAGSWAFARRGMLRATMQATDAAGAEVGFFDPRTIRRGGTLTWGGRELGLRPASHWKDRYALADGDRELAVLEGKGWGRRPVRITIDDPAEVEPGLLLFAAFVVRGLAEDTASASGGAASSAATAG
jgi:hypothetical protein